MSDEALGNTSGIMWAARLAEDRAKDAEIANLRATHSNLIGTNRMLKAQVAERDTEIAKLGAEVERRDVALTADDQTLRLHLGEMTAQEMRTLRAGFSWVLARAALTPAEEKTDV
jgi:hypothetical protein